LKPYNNITNNAGKNDETNASAMVKQMIIEILVSLCDG